MGEVLNIKKISTKQAKEIIACRLPLGLFYTKEKSKGKKVYVGIDNSDGDAWTEEFKWLRKCKKWLSKKSEVNN